MTEKRFSWDWSIEFERVVVIDHDNSDYEMFENECCEKLNELHEENQQLKRDLKTLRLQDNDRYEYQKDLQEENEQLKKENYELHKRLGDFEPFEGHIKERTSKTSLEDIISFVKTDESTNSVELKKGLYK